MGRSSIPWCSTSTIHTIDQLRSFLAGTLAMQFQPGGSAEDRYGFIQRTFQRFHYSGLRRAEKGIALRYLGRMAGYSRKPLTRLVRQYSSESQLRRRHAPPVAGFVRKFRAQAVALLAETDTLHGTLSGPATKRLMQRALEVCGDTRYDRLASISVAHLYNLRKVSGYATRRQRLSSAPLVTLRPEHGIASEVYPLGDGDIDSLVSGAPSYRARCWLARAHSIRNVPRPEHARSSPSKHTCSPSSRSGARGSTPIR